MLACVTLLCAASALAQGGAMSPYQDEKDGVAAGGKWTMFQSEDKMTGAKKVRFELVADNYFREDPEYKINAELHVHGGGNRAWGIQDLRHPHARGDNP